METKFRLDAKHLFLTYPHCDLDKQIAYDYLRLKFEPELILVAREVHADGTPHLHAYLGLQRKRHWSDAHFADLVHYPQIFHGNYQAARSPQAAAKYATKDGDFIANFDPAKTSTRKLRKWAAEQIINQKRPLSELVREEPELIHGYNRLQIDINAFLRDEEAEACVDLPPFLPNPWGLLLPSKRAAKRRHFWIWSSQPNLGKSFLFAKPLQEEYGAVIVAGDFSYWPVHRGVKLLILDEFNTAGLKYSQLNSICDGTFGYRVFHGGVVKLACPLIIVLSNQSISSLYPNMHELLYARFNEKKLD